MPVCPYCKAVFGSQRAKASHMVIHKQSKKILQDEVIVVPDRGSPVIPVHEPMGPMVYNDPEYEPMVYNDPEYEPMVYSDPEYEPMGYNDPEYEPMGYNDPENHEENEANLAMKFYLTYQYKFCSALYGPKAFYSDSWKSFVDFLLSENKQYKSDPLCKINSIKIKSFVDMCKLSFAKFNLLIKLFQDIAGPEDIPTGPVQAKRLSLEGTQKNRSVLDVSLPPSSFVVPFPKEWRMELWNTNRRGSAPLPIALLARDPIACIAEQFMNPTIAFFLRHHLKFQYEAQYQEKEGDYHQIYGDLCTSNWFKDTEAEVRMRIPSACLLPIILYHDGVNVGSYQNVTPVLATCGNYSDEMQRMDKAKFCIGYITNLDMIKLPTIIAHLKEKAGFCKTSATAQVKSFCLKINQMYWKLVTKSIRENYNNGVLIKLLGDRIYHFMPVVPFTVGDEPAQHLLSGVMQGNANRSCVNCTYRRKDNLPYSIQNYPPRNADLILTMCAEAEKINKRKYLHLDLPEEADKMQASYERARNNKITRIDKTTVKKHAYSAVELSTIKYLSENSIEPMSNAFHGVYMGYRTSIYDTPGDLFHVFCAGLQKSATSWIMTIVDSLSKLDNKYENASALLDQRLKDYPHNPELPHMVNTFFKTGLTSLGTNKSTSEKHQATGSGKGYRSSWWGCALLQIFFCIGYHGDVLPNDINYKVNVTVFDKAEKKKSTRLTNLGNPTSKVFNLIYSLQNVYFQCKRTSFTEANIQQLENDLKSIDVHLTLLWDLKQAITAAPADKVLQIRKIHTARHIVSYINKWGSLSKMNSDRFESAHQKFTTQVFERSSGRKVTLEAEMLNLTITDGITEHIEIASGIRAHGGEKYKESIVSRQSLEEFVSFIAAGGNCCHWKLRYSSELEDKFTIVDKRARNKKKNENKKESLLQIFLALTVPTAFQNVKILKDILHPQIDAKLFYKRLFDILNVDGIDDNYDENLTQPFYKHWWSLIKKGKLYVRVLSAVTYKGNAESMVGSGTIYATLHFSPRQNKPRFDFVSVQFDNSIELAQVLNFIEISNGNGECALYAYVAWLTKEDGQYLPKNTIKTGIGYAPFDYFERYRYCSDEFYKGTQFKCQIDLIDVTTIMGPAYIVPDFKDTDLSLAKPSRHHRFFLVHRKWTDRSDWEDLIAPGPLIHDNMEDYLKRMGTDRPRSVVAAEGNAMRSSNRRITDYFDIDLNDDNDDNGNEYDDADDDDDD